MLHYSYIDPQEPISVPKPQVNGGLYTGEPFKQNAPWGNIAIEPESHVYAEKLNRLDSIPGYTRLGNNTQQFPAHEKYDKKNRFICLRK
jgi:hypothetical protein